MRVLHVDPAREWRGGQTQLALLVRGAPGLGVAVVLDSPLAHALANGPVAVHPCLGGPLAAVRLRALVRALDPDVIAAHTSKAHALALLACGGRPVIVHRRVDFAVGTGPFGTWKRVKYRAAAGYVAVSEAVRDVLIAGGVEPSRIDVVPDAVDPAPWAVPVARSAARARLGVPDEVPWFAAVGALVEHKGHRVLIDAMASVPRAILTIAGEGPLRARLQAQIDARGLSARVRLLGMRDDVPDWLGAADLFVHPSLEEGLGQAVIEAMLARVPIVASRAGGVPEVVREDGVLVPPGDVKALVAALQAPARSPAPATARLRERHAPEALVKGTLAAYARFVAGATPPTSR